MEISPSSISSVAIERSDNKSVAHWKIQEGGKTYTIKVTIHSGDVKEDNLKNLASDIQKAVKSDLKALTGKKLTGRLKKKGITQTVKFQPIAGLKETKVVRNIEKAFENMLRLIPKEFTIKDIQDHKFQVGTSKNLRQQESRQDLSSFVAGYFKKLTTRSQSTTALEVDVKVDESTIPRILPLNNRQMTEQDVKEMQIIAKNTFKKLLENRGFKPETIEPKLEGSPKEQVKQIKKAYLKAYKKHFSILKSIQDRPEKEFNKFLSRERGLIVPPLERTFTVDDTEYTEKAAPLSTQPGTAYLKKVMDAKSPYIPYSEKLKEKGVRPSSLKKDESAQGVVINAWEHSIESKGSTRKIFRSGAFSTHGRKKPGLSALKEKYKALSPEEQKSEKGKKMQAEIELRTKLLTAQALSKIIPSIQNMAQDEESVASALKAKSFLHIEQSFLSDAHSEERAMIEDMRGVMDHLRENLKIQFTEDEVEDPVEISDTGTITFKIQTDKKELYNHADPFGLTALFFTQGVNERQAFGRAFSSEEPLQDQINKDSLEKLRTYALDAKKEDKPAIRELLTHFSEDEKRHAKDIDGVIKIAKTVETLGGRRGIVCKSGKDRTSCEASRDLAGGKEEVQKTLSSGISLVITGYNTGKRAYAFNPGQYETLPKRWRPEIEDCSAGQES